MPTFLDLVSIDLILLEICPHLPILSLVNLASTSKQVRSILHQTRGAFRYFDLSTRRTTSTDVAPIDRGGFSWRAERMDENLTEDDFYSGPMRGTFSRLRKWSILGDIQTLILDRQTVTADIVYEIINGNEFRVKILSLLDVQAMNQGRLRQALAYACRDSRSKGTPTLQALYLFSDANSGTPSSMEGPGVEQQMADIVATVGAQLGTELSEGAVTKPSFRALHPCYRDIGSTSVLNRAELWAPTMNKCRDIIAFDAALCRGPRHDPLTGGAAPAIATVPLSPLGCKECGKMPEGFVVGGKTTMSAVPLLRPIPTYAFSNPSFQLMYNRVKLLSCIVQQNPGQTLAHWFAQIREPTSPLDVS